ncbi:hypothetical protein [Bacteroides sp. 519]|uniref:hypothetical protein n=1 Tax=Bacteroides sp. 519 TaxID=2302937 RepID=UPI0013D6C342|nr:hypothetical protein [Bacteroides sp. 519]NDV57478.1 hypothetical protein [Bacteroides sp. 519]
MKHYIVHIIIYLLLPLHVSCQQAPKHLSYKQPYNLEKIDWQMNVNKFYWESPDVFAADSEGKTSGTPGSEITIYTDTVQAWWREENYPYNEQNENIGIGYNMMGWNAEKTIATYMNMNFSKMHMITSPDNKLIAIAAINEKTKNMGTPQNRTWNEGDIIYKLVLKSSKAYLFILKKEYEDKITKIFIGDFTEYR